MWDGFAGYQSPPGAAGCSTATTARLCGVLHGQLHPRSSIIRCSQSLSGQRRPALRARRWVSMISRSMTASSSPSAGTVSMWSASPELGDTRTDTLYSISILAFFWRPGPRTPPLPWKPAPGFIRSGAASIPVRSGSIPPGKPRGGHTNRAWDSTRACSRSWRATRAQTVHCGSPAHPTVITTPGSGACACTRSLGRNGRGCWNWMVRCAV